MDVPPDELAAEVAYQIGALEVFARAAGTAVAYVKPHGALYNRAVHDAEQAAAVVAGVRLAGELPVLGLPGSQLLTAAARAGLGTVCEAFADRAYTAAGTLVSRREPGAVVEDGGRGRGAGGGARQGRRGDGADRGAGGGRGAFAVRARGHAGRGPAGGPGAAGAGGRGSQVEAFA